MRSLTVAQVAERHTVSPAVVLAWIGAGSLAAIDAARHAGAKRPSWRITEAALAAFEAARTPKPPAPKQARRKPSDVIEFY